MEDDEPKVYLGDSEKEGWVTCRDWKYWYDMWDSASDDAIALRKRVAELEKEAVYERWVRDANQRALRLLKRYKKEEDGYDRRVRDTDPRNL